MTEENKSLQKHDPFKTALSSPGVKARFEEMLGKRAASFMSSILSAVNANPQLKACDPMSVIAAASIAASMELPINSSLGLAHIVPYKGRAQFQIGWKGFMQLALRSGQYKTIHLTAVYEGQIKSMNSFTGEIEFTPTVPTKDAKQIGYLLYFKLLTGYEKYFYMTAESMDAHARKYSPSYKQGRGIWADDFEAMALKTVCKLGLSKYGILSLEMQQAIEVDQLERAAPHAVESHESVKEDSVKGVTQKDPELIEAEFTESAEEEVEMPNPFENQQARKP